MEINAKLGDQISITTLNDGAPGPYSGTITGFCSYATAQAFSKPSTIDIVAYHQQVIRSCNQSTTISYDIPTDPSKCSYVLITDNAGVVYPIALEWINNYNCTSDYHQYMIKLTCTQDEYKYAVTLLRKQGIACTFISTVD